jgi:hypothetical protein
MEAEGVWDDSRGVWVHEACEKWMSLDKDWAESDLCNSMRVGEAVLPATWSHPDSLEPDVGGQYITWEWVTDESLESRRWRLYCVNIGFWMNVDFFNPKSHVHVGVIVLTIFIFLMVFSTGSWV